MMREVSYVKRLKFSFAGSVVKRALVIGDADNDQHNELLCASLQGDLSIFKERNPEKYAHADNLGMVTACAIGDVMNSGRNYVMAIDMEGWLFILSVPGASSTYNVSPIPPSSENNYYEESQSSQGPDTPIELDKLYCQRMPANCKELLLVDLDGDGQNELIIGLTDRVLRTYKWVKIGLEQGKFVGLYKWEFADQIGSVSLTPNPDTDRQDIIVAQPGGTYAKLRCYNKKLLASPKNQPDKGEDSQSVKSAPSPRGDEDVVGTEYIASLTPEYHQLALNRMRNPHVSTEALGGIRNSRDGNRGSLIAIATLDGTLMLVDSDEIRWNIQVDHQLFALAVLECPIVHRHTLPQSESSCTIVPNTEYRLRITSPDSISPQPKIDEQYFVACAWNGKTYIIDEERNYLRFKFEEAISAFMAGNYYFDGQDHACLVYATFNNEIVVYYDVVSEPISPSYLLEEIDNPEHFETLSKVETLMDRVKMSEYGRRYLDHEPNAMSQGIYNMIHDILYGISDQDLNS